MFLLEIKDLKVKADNKEILKGVNLKIKKGETQALLGPNGSGKSCLCQVILGNPAYKITSGKIFFEGKDITKMPSEKRVKLGLALTWQSPPAIKGLKLSELCPTIEKRSFLNIKEANDLLKRDVNVDFSGGEKKTSELLQVLCLNPKLVIFDEIDAGLDIKKLGQVAEIIKTEFIRKNVSVLLITHSGQILNYLKPDITNVMLDGKILCQKKDFKNVLRIIKKYGYEKCKKCPVR